MMDLIPLFTGVIDVAPALSVGAGPAGPRSVGAIVAASFTGDGFKAELAGPAADWMILNGSVGVIDVRMTMRTDDGALIYVQYGGRLDLSNPAAGIVAYVAPVFETGDPRYAWLNAVQAVGKGTVTLNEGAAHIDYEFFQLR